jgi:Domain of unknown function (DU1801)
MPVFENSDVAAVFASYPEPIRIRLLELRALIFEVAQKTQSVESLEEALRWKQPSYLTPSKSGSMIRIGQIKDSSDLYAMFFHCQTSLVQSFQSLYENDFIFQGNRCIVFNSKHEINTEKLAHCIRLALTYHQTKNTLK